MKLKSLFATCIATILITAIPAAAALKIVATTTDYADIARQIGGDAVEVHSVMKGPENVHNVIPNPPEMQFLADADLFVHSGLDTEPWRDNLLNGARNPRVRQGQPGWVDMSAGIELKDVPTGKIGRDQGDVHAYGNPHYTLNPQNAQRMAATLVKAMIQVDPARADMYKKNAIAFVKSMAQTSKEIKEKFAPYAGLKIITFHDAWKYLADAVPIEIVGTIEPHPAITPSGAQVEQTIAMMKARGVKIVICETYDDKKLAQYVADQAGAKMIVLPDHVLGVPDADSYQKLFQYDVEKLLEAAKAAGVEPKPAAGGVNAH
jgi:zinc/manganese transport system substrate-binding protein